MSAEKIKDGGHAFPPGIAVDHAGDTYHGPYGMSLRDWFAGQALMNPAICTGTAPEYELRRWFGGRGGITRTEIASAQAYEYADAMLKAREAQP